MNDPLIIIPSRMAAQRLPGKPMADICGKPMIARMVERALKAGVGRVIVATDHQDIFDVAVAEGAEAVMTNPALPSGSDRVWAAAERIDPERKHDIVVNLQGDMPSYQPVIIGQCVDVLTRFKRYDISTLVAPIHTEEEKQTDAVVKAVVNWHPLLRAAKPRGNPGSHTPQSNKSEQNAVDRHASLAMTESAVGRAMYFSRQCIPTNGPWWHHLGIYAFRRDALEKFVSLPPSELEKSERLEQLRAMEAGMQIGIGQTAEAPMGVDTPEMLEVVRRQFKNLV